MPKVHTVGSLFVQFTNFPYEWENKYVIRGWTQEINEPFRTSSPFIVRLPKYKALVFGRWTGHKTEEEALKDAVKGREATEDEFSEEKGWTPPAADETREESLDDIFSRFDSVDGTSNVYDWKTYHLLAEESERR